MGSNYSTFEKKSSPDQEPISPKRKSLLAWERVENMIKSKSSSTSSDPDATLTRNKSSMLRKLMRNNFEKDNSPVPSPKLDPNTDPDSNFDYEIVLRPKNQEFSTNSLPNPKPSISPNPKPSISHLARRRSDTPDLSLTPERSPANSKLDLKSVQNGVF